MLSATALGCSHTIERGSICPIGFGTAKTAAQPAELELALAFELLDVKSVTRCAQGRHAKRAKLRFEAVNFPNEGQLKFSSLRVSGAILCDLGPYVRAGGLVLDFALSFLK